MSSEAILSSMVLRIAKWVSIREEFENVMPRNIIHNLKACVSCGLSKERIVISSSPPPLGVLKFNVDEAARGKPGPAGIGVLCKNKGEVLFLCSKQ